MQRLTPQVVPDVVQYSRRAVLRIGGAGLLGLTMPKLMAAEANASGAKAAIKPRAKSVIFLFQWGGPSQLDMFDMKPDAPDGVRSPFKSISSSLVGEPVCEHLPKTSQIMHKVTLIRTMTHRMTNHNSASGRGKPRTVPRLRPRCFR